MEKIDINDFAFIYFEIKTFQYTNLTINTENKVW